MFSFWSILWLAVLTAESLAVAQSNTVDPSASSRIFKRAYGVSEQSLSKWHEGHVKIHIMEHGNTLQFNTEYLLLPNNTESAEISTGKLNVESFDHNKRTVEDSLRQITNNLMKHVPGLSFQYVRSRNYYKSSNDTLLVGQMDAQWSRESPMMSTFGFSSHRPNLLLISPSLFQKPKDLKRRLMAQFASVLGMQKENYRSEAKHLFTDYNTCSTTVIGGIYDYLSITHESLQQMKFSFDNTIGFNYKKYVEFKFTRSSTPDESSSSSDPDQSVSTDKQETDNNTADTSAAVEAAEASNTPEASLSKRGWFSKSSYWKRPQTNHHVSLTEEETLETVDEGELDGDFVLVANPSETDSKDQAPLPETKHQTQNSPDTEDPHLLSDEAVNYVEKNEDELEEIDDPELEEEKICFEQLMTAKYLSGRRKCNTRLETPSVIMNENFSRYAEKYGKGDTLEKREAFVVKNIGRLSSFSALDIQYLNSVYPYTVPAEKKTRTSKKVVVRPRFIIEELEEIIAASRRQSTAAVPSSF